MEYPILVGILLVSIGSNCFACSVHAIQEDLRTPINKVFLVLGLAIAIWSLGLAITVTAANETICDFGRRLAPFGWGTVLSLLLHFTLLLTQKNNILEKRWIYPIIYLPAAVTIFAYTYLPLIGLNQDRLIRNELGWINISSTDAWDWFYYGYALIFAVISIFLVYLWFRKSNSDKIKKQGKLLVFSSIIASFLGMLTDVIPIFLGIRIPQVSAIFAILPAVAVAYSIKHHGFLRSEIQNQNELILNESAYNNIYKYIALLCAVGAVIIPIAQKLLYDSLLLVPTIMFSTILILTAGSIFLFQIKRVDNVAKGVALVAGLSLTIPLGTLGLTSNIKTSMWALIFLFFIIFMLFNRRTILIAVLTTSILTQMVLWAAAPNFIVKVDGLDYVIQITVIAIAAILALYVNKIYVQRLKENANQIGIQKLIAQISHDFVSVNERNFNEKTMNMLKQCGSFIGSDKASIALLDQDKDKVYYSAEWRSRDIQTQAEPFGELKKEMRAVLLKEFEFNNIVRLHDAKFMSFAENFTSRAQVEMAQSILALPIKKQGDIIGIMVFVTPRPSLYSNLESFTYLEIIANIIVDAITKTEAEREINFIAYHDQLTLLPNRILFKSELERKIRRAKRNGTMFAVAFLDIDSFKTVNDTMGHDLGDRLLSEAARILSLSIRPDDIIARYGGDEFVILINNIDSKKNIENIMDRIIEAFYEPVQLNEREYNMSVSVGVALYPQDAGDAKSLLKCADTAMYTSKMRGKSQYSLYSPEMHESAQSIN
ncbi:MAG: diguanylate cyclase [Eubacteriales bacterium]|nr:diguanylate cyclase [Eubacteriales bacterium]